ncbi:MAG: PQQ-binding-like beta-propeller repeat protein [Planctomycetota bacterium]|nr:PQQ-binding-like beta-propeller repeat protein [Planctomycetota bacterium]
MGLQGDISFIALSEVFQLITASDKEGTLIIYDHQKNRREIYFGKDGIRLLSIGERKGLPIGEILVKKKLVTPAQLSQALTTQKTTNLKLGEILCHLGFIKQDVLEKIIHNQIEDEIYDIFRWEQAKFEFVEGPPPTPPLMSDQNPVSILTLDVKVLIDKTNQRNKNWQEVKNSFKSHNSLFKLTDDYEEKLPYISLSEDEKRILRIIKGFKTLQDIVDESSIGTLDTYKTASSLLEKKIIREVEDAEVKNYARHLLKEKKFTEALFFYQQALKANPKDITIIGNIAEVLERLERPTDAGFEYKKLGKLLWDKNDLNLATVSYKKAITFFPSDEELYNNLFNLYVLQNQPREAANIGKELIKLYARSKKMQEVQTLYEKIASVYKPDLELRSYLISAYFQMGEYTKSREELDKAIRGLPSQKTHTLIKAYETVVSVDSRHSDARYRLDSLRKIKLETDRKRRKIIILAGAFLLLLCLTGIFALNDYLQYKKFLILKNDIEELKKNQEYDSALAKCQAFNRSFTIYTKSQVQKEIDVLLTLLQSKEKRISTIFDAELSSFKELCQKAIQIKQKDNDFDTALKMLQETELKVQQSRTTIKERVHKMDGTPDITDRYTNSYQQFIEEIKKETLAIEQYLTSAKELYLQAKELDKAEKLEESAKVIRLLVNKYPASAVARNARIPVKIESVPSSAEIFLNDKRQGRTPLKVYLPIKGAATLTVSKKGFVTHTREVRAYEQYHLSILLEKTHLWSFDTGYPLQTTSLLVDGTVFITTRDGYLKALNSENGTLKWAFRTDTPTEIHSSPRLNNKLVLFGADDNKLYAVRSSDPVKVYQIQTANPIRADAFFSPDRKITLIGSTDKHLYAMREDRTPLWNYNTKAKISSTGLVDEKGVVYITSEDGMLHSLDLNTGTKMWELSLGGKPNSPIMKGDTLYIGSTNNTVYAIDLIKRQIQWSSRLRREIVAPLTISANILLVPCQDGNLYALDIKSQNILWQFGTKGALTGEVAVSEKDGIVYFGSEDFYFYAVKLSDGKEVWKYKTKGSIRSTPIMGNQMLYIGSDDGNLYAIEK